MPRAKKVTSDQWEGFQGELSIIKSQMLQVFNYLGISVESEDEPVEDEVYFDEYFENQQHEFDRENGQPSDLEDIVDEPQPYQAQFEHLQIEHRRLRDEYDELAKTYRELVNQHAATVEEAQARAEYQDERIARQRRFLAKAAAEKTWPPVPSNDTPAEARPVEEWDRLVSEGPDR